MQRYGYSIFCDDIRNEVDGKLSFIGCYNAVMFVAPVFPFVLPKFCIHLHIVSPAGQPFSSILARCYAPGQDEPIVEEPMKAPDRETQGRLIEDLGVSEAAPRLIVAAASLIFTPLEIQAPGLIKVRAAIDGNPEELKIGSLRVMVAE